MEPAIVKAVVINAIGLKVDESHKVQNLNIRHYAINREIIDLENIDIQRVGKYAMVKLQCDDIMYFIPIINGSNMLDGEIKSDLRYKIMRTENGECDLTFLSREFCKDIQTFENLLDDYGNIFGDNIKVEYNNDKPWTPIVVKSDKFLVRFSGAVNGLALIDHLETIARTMCKVLKDEAIAKILKKSKKLGYFKEIFTNYLILSKVINPYGNYDIEFDKYIGECLNSDDLSDTIIALNKLIKNQKNMGQKEVFRFNVSDRSFHISKSQKAIFAGCYNGILMVAYVNSEDDKNTLINKLEDIMKYPAYIQYGCGVEDRSPTMINRVYVLARNLLKKC